MHAQLVLQEVNLALKNDKSLLMCCFFFSTGLITQDPTQATIASASLEPSNAPNQLPAIEVVAEVPVEVSANLETEDSVRPENQTAASDAGQEEEPPQSKTLQNILRKTSQTRVSKQSILKEACVEKAALSDEASRLLNVAHKYKCRSTKTITKLKEANSRLKELEKPGAHLKALSDHISPALYILLEGELTNSSRDPHGRRWTEEQKGLNLALKMRARKSYALLEKLLVIPCGRTLETLLSEIPVGPGINEGIFDHLAHQVQTMRPQEKFVSIMWDEFKGQGGLHFIEKKGIITGFENFGFFGTSNLPADEGLIFLIRSLDPDSDWKMPLAIFFSCAMCPAEILKKLVVQIITKLQKIGLRVAATVCDQGPANQKVIRELHEEARKKTSRVEPEIIVNGQTFVTFWDTPHAFKNVINNWRLDNHKCIEYGPP